MLLNLKLKNVKSPNLRAHPYLSNPSRLPEIMIRLVPFWPRASVRHSAVATAVVDAILKNFDVAVLPHCDAWVNWSNWASVVFARNPTGHGLDTRSSRDWISCFAFSSKSFNANGTMGFTWSLQTSNTRSSDIKSPSLHCFCFGPQKGQHWILEFLHLSWQTHHQKYTAWTDERRPLDPGRDSLQSSAWALLLTALSTSLAKRASRKPSFVLLQRRFLVREWEHSPWWQAPNTLF